MQLRTQLQELEKRVSDLTATNEFLLDQVYCDQHFGSSDCNTYL